MYVHFLTNVQNPYFLTIGGLLPLNWPTCVQVNMHYIKTINAVFIVLIDSFRFSAFQINLLLD